MRASPGSAPDFAIFDTEAGVSTTERRLPKMHPFEDSQKYWTLYILGAGFSVLPNEALLPSPAQSRRPEKLPRQRGLRPVAILRAVYPRRNFPHLDLVRSVGDHKKIHFLQVSKKP